MVKAKRVHKYTVHTYYGEYFPIVVSRSIIAACKIHNKTYAWHGSYRWDRVTCLRCLKSRGEK